MILKFPFQKPHSELEGLQKKPDADLEFSNAINIFKSQRNNSGISLEELSNKTKISRNVLIAIENGWRKYLPEKTYLFSMIKTLEHELGLERGSLKGLLVQEISVNNLSRFKFNFINIDFLNSWIGSLIYFILMLLSILAINIQQKYLLKINSVSTEPILLEEDPIQNLNKINIKKIKEEKQ
tara:strand:- start:122 stop:667 length:546 start_codon:yes stop_codon:yes gene_type:complete